MNGDLEILWKKEGTIYLKDEGPRQATKKSQPVQYTRINSNSYE
jgi:hypothetical protein